MEYAVEGPSETVPPSMVLPVFHAVEEGDPLDFPLDTVLVKYILTERIVLMVVREKGPLGIMSHGRVTVVAKKEVNNTGALLQLELEPEAFAEWLLARDDFLSLAMPGVSRGSNATFGKFIAVKCGPSHVRLAKEAPAVGTPQTVVELTGREVVLMTTCLHQAEYYRTVPILCIPL